MQIAVFTLTLYAPWVHSLKEKRMEVKSLITKLRAKFNISVAETDSQDIHQTIVISIAAIAANTALRDSIIDHCLHFVEANTEAEVVQVVRENY